MLPVWNVPEVSSFNEVTVLVKDELTVTVLFDWTSSTLVPGIKSKSPEKYDPPSGPVALSLEMVSTESNSNVLPV